MKRFFSVILALLALTGLALAYILRWDVKLIKAMEPIGLKIFKPIRRKEEAGRGKSKKDDRRSSEIPAKGGEEGLCDPAGVVKDQMKRHAVHRCRRRADRNDRNAAQKPQRADGDEIDQPAQKLCEKGILLKKFHGCSAAPSVSCCAAILNLS